MKTLKNQILVLLNMILFVNCSSNKKLIPSINGYYTIKFYKSSSTNRTVILGNIYEYKTNLPLPLSVVKVNDYFRHNADIKGKYKFTVLPDNLIFTGTAYPYKYAETNSIDVHKGDSIRIDFYLKPVVTPIYD